MRGNAFMSTMATLTTYKRDNLPHLLRYEKKTTKYYLHTKYRD